MIQRVFWGWEQPVLDQAVSLLTQDWQEGELDLGDTLIVTPTAESGRRLKEALARKAHNGDGAVSAPHVWAPERALLTTQDRTAAASDTQLLLAWTRVMIDADITALTHLFPVPPLDTGWTWATEMAKAMMDVSITLGAGGHGFADIAAMDDLPRERERWVELASLERACHGVLAELGRQDAQWLKRQRAAHPELPEGVRRILVLAAPDLPVLFRRWLEAAARQVPVTLYVQAPAALAAQFDAFGAPLKSCWGEKAPVVVPLDNAHLHLEHDPAEQTRKALDLMRSLVPHHEVALGVCDPEVTAHLEDHLRQEDVRIYEPGGVPANRHGTVQMLSLWVDLFTTDGWQAFAKLLRVPDVRDALMHGSGEFAMKVVAEADRLATERLPVTLTHALELIPSYTEEYSKSPFVPPLRTAMEAAREMAREFKRLPLPEAARHLLIKLYGERHYKTDRPKDRDHVQICTDWLHLCQELHDEAAHLGLKTSNTNLLGLSVDWLKRQRLTEPRGEIDLVLSGWLELLWEPAPGLILTGFNEEHVPGILISHPFLPDQLRESLGLACQANRFARDAFLLRALAGQRQNGGTLEVICGLWSEGKDTLRPSRLLFLCEDRALPERVRHLFPKEFESTLPRELPRQRAWPLRPRKVERQPLERVSASRLSAYLRCPFTYYLDYELGMTSVDARKRELDAMEYGNLIHTALAELKHFKGADEEALTEVLVRAVDDWAAKRHGKRLPVPVEVQIDSARQRLRAAAHLEAGLRASGWRTVDTERKLGEDDDTHPLVIEGARFRGRVDRIDHHPDGITRIIDYKTGDEARTPLAAHLKEVGKRTKIDPEDEWKLFAGSDGKIYLWQDLQLPLYAKAWSLHDPSAIQTAYWSLPKAMEAAAVDVFEPLDATMINAALACASEAIRRINAGLFWPPAKGSRFDQYEGLIHGDVHEAVVWEEAETEQQGSAPVTEGRRQNLI